ncbi:HDIG domain-containing metalloprotein [candidate division KSB1 bacterium]
MKREDAFALLREYTKNENLIKHALAVESVMKAYAKKYGEDENKWGITGLLHDFDYEKYPTQEKHPIKGSEILKERGYPEDVRYAILCHADYLGLEKKSLMDKTLTAIDELTGFIVAVTLVRPNKKLNEVKVKSVRKKMKDKAFARQVSREDIIKGAELMDTDLNSHIEFVLNAMKEISDDLGL